MQRSIRDNAGNSRPATAPDRYWCHDLRRPPNPAGRIADARLPRRAKTLLVVQDCAFQEETSCKEFDVSSSVLERP
jgi:hypothetical protein